MNHSENRILARRGSRELTREEVELVTGALGNVHTNSCSVNLTTGQLDGDACGH